MLQFISFGSGSSGNSCLLFTENEGLLIDAGIGVRTLRKHLREYGIPLSKINNILITHDHADHVMSVGSLSRDFQLPVYTTEKVHKGIYGNWCVKHKIAQNLQKVIEKGQTFQLGDFQITPFEVPHDSTDNVGYKIVAHGVCFCLMTDIGIVTDEMKTIIAEAQ